MHPGGTARLSASFEFQHTSSGPFVITSSRFPPTIPTMRIIYLPTSAQDEGPDALYIPCLSSVSHTHVPFKQMHVFDRVFTLGVCGTAHTWKGSPFTMVGCISFIYKHTVRPDDHSIHCDPRFSSAAMARAGAPPGGLSNIAIGTRTATVTFMMRPALTLSDCASFWITGAIWLEVQSMAFPIRRLLCYLLSQVAYFSTLWTWVHNLSQSCNACASFDNSTFGAIRVV